MAKLEEIIQGKQLRGILPGQAVTIVAAMWCGSDALALTYRSVDGKLDDPAFRPGATSIRYN